MSLSLGKLQTSENLLITTLRLYWASTKTTEGASADWRSGLLAACGTRTGADAFGELAGIIAATVLRPLDIHGSRCFCIGEDEIHFLRVIGFLQRGQTDNALMALAAWLPPSALRLAEMPARALALALMTRELMVPLRHPHMTIPHPSHLEHANSGMMLVQ